MDDLPPEIVHEILGCLDQDDLRRTAAVSRTFYASSWRAGLFIHRKLLWEQGKSCAARLTTLSKVVQHARTKSLRLSLSLVFRSYGKSESHINSSASGTPYAQVLSLIPVALPVLVVLSVGANGAMMSRVTDVLNHPAPILRSLSISGVSGYTGYTMAVPELRADLFTGIAPKLRSLVLHDIILAQNPIAAFAHIRTLNLAYTAIWPEIAFARHFPVLRSLALSIGLVKASPTPQSIPFNLHGVRLERLTIEESFSLTLMPALLCGDDPIDVPVLNYSCPEAPWIESLWHRTNDGPFSIRLMAYTDSDADVRILIAPGHRRWFREYNVDEWQTDWPFPIADLPQLAERLAYLRMDNLYLIGFLECKGLSFHALREIQLDFYAEATHSGMVWPPDWTEAFVDYEFSFDDEDGSAPTFSKESYCYVDCKALDTLRLFAVYQEMSVASQEVAYLGRALSQCLRRKQDRAALEVHGVKLQEPIARALLEETFSDVRQYDFAGWDSPVGRDSGMWDNR